MAFAGNGFIQRTGDKIRLYIDDPDVSAKYTDANIKEAMRRAFADVYSDVNRVNSGKAWSSITVSVVKGTAEYELPPTISQFFAFEDRDNTDGNYQGEIIPLDPLHPVGPQFRIEPPIIRFDPMPQVDDILTLMYLPSGEAPIFEGVAAGTSTTTTIDTTSVTEGQRDLRPNSYNGYTLTQLNATGQPLLHRKVTAYDATSLTVAPALPAAWVSSETFEVVPLHAYRLEDVVAYKAARTLSGTAGDAERQVALNFEYKDALRTLRLDMAYMEARVGQRMRRTIRHKRRSMYGVARR